MGISGPKVEHFTQFYHSQQVTKPNLSVLILSLLSDSIPLIPKTNTHLHILSFMKALHRNRLRKKLQEP